MGSNGQLPISDRHAENVTLRELTVGAKRRYWMKLVSRCIGSHAMSEDMRYTPYVASSETTI